MEREQKEKHAEGETKGEVSSPPFIIIFDGFLIIIIIIFIVSSWWTACVTFKEPDCD